MATWLRRCLVLIGAALLPWSALRADSFFGPTVINFDQLGATSYNLWFAAELVVGGDAYATANAGFGSIFGSSFSYIGEAGVRVSMENIRRVNGVWTAEYVVKQEFSNYTGQYEYTYYYNQPLPTSGWVSGSAECGSESQSVVGSIVSFGPPPPAPPVPTIAVSGYAHGAWVPATNTLSVNFAATDVNANLSGIRINVWYRTESSHQNDGGAFVPQSGSSGSVVRSVPLTYSGEYYFWTEATDTAGSSASTPAWANGFRIFVPWRTPCYQPTYWNGGPLITNNCYNYANNRRTDTFAQPGNGGGTTFDLYHPDINVVANELRAAAVADGLEETWDTATSATGKTKIALVLRPGTSNNDRDFHWYRQDCDGRWSHKIGESPATNLDNSGQLIVDPRSADRGAYTVFVGFFFTPSDAVQGMGHATIH